jgi:ABC-type enterochelin transport system ATPase subunit
MIEIKNLRKEFDELVAVDDLTLTIPSGEIYGLIGPNGAGHRRDCETRSRVKRGGEAHGVQGFLPLQSNL